VFTARYVLPTQCIHVSCVDLRTNSGYYMYRQFNTQKFYVLPTQCIYVFCVYLRKKQRLFHCTSLMFAVLQIVKVNSEFLYIIKVNFH
jgi:hypothetical protein